MTSDDLFNVAMNNRPAYEHIVASVRRLRASINDLAVIAARDNAEWYDDLNGADYAEHHAPAGEQFPRDVRDKTIKDLVEYFLAELPD